MASMSKALSALGPVERAGGGVMRRVLELALDGVGPLPSARTAASRALGRSGDHEAAIDRAIRNHVALASASGFVTNLGGFATMPVSVPANVIGVSIVQLRLVGVIAHLRGYDVTDARVRSAVMLALLGPASKDGLPDSPVLVATAPVFDAALDKKISERLVADVTAQVGGKRAATLVGRRIPLLGGAVGGSVDGWSTYMVARNARKAFTVRRAR